MKDLWEQYEELQELYSYTVGYLSDQNRELRVRLAIAQERANKAEKALTDRTTEIINKHYEKAQQTPAPQFGSPEDSHC